jgi:hypothetical protein
MEHTLGIVLATLAKEGLVSAFKITLFSLAILSGSILYVYACDTNHTQHP